MTDDGTANRILEEDEELTGFEFTDRYGGRAPSYLRGCFACEAMGVFPLKNPLEHIVEGGIRRRELNTDILLWNKAIAEGAEPDDIGYIFVKCPDCGGKGRVRVVDSIKRIPKWLARGLNPQFILTCFEGETFHKGLKMWMHCAFINDLRSLRN